MRLVWATVLRVYGPGGDVLRLEAECREDGTTRVAVCYPKLTGPVAPGDEVLLNATAVDLGLGTGGVDFVVSCAPPAAVRREGAGHTMKVRYTPLQTDVLCVEEQGSEHHAAMASAEDVGGMPIVCCGLHSQAPLAAAAVKAVVPHANVTYVMTDHAALPMAFSDLVRASAAAGLFDETVTCGQAFGGGMEAVNLHSGLLAARHVAGADVAIVAQGPGIVGTATPFGHGGVAQGEAVNAAACVGGSPVAVLRLSFADTRQRHRGVSHHSLVALGRVAVAPATVAVPALPSEQAAQVDGALAAVGVWDRHVRRDVDTAGAGVDMRGVAVRTMGRGAAEDPAFFAAALAAGIVAGMLLGERGAP